MEKRYRLVFRGELLTGHALEDVQPRAAQRLGANATQLERLFSGQSVVLKRGLAIDAAARYARELRQLGMRMHVEPDGEAPPKPAVAPAEFRIVFQGLVVPGFDPVEVMQAARERLHATADQAELLFSGRKTTLKKGLEADQATRYAARLRGIGMLVAIEAVTETGPVVPPRAKARARAEANSAASHADTLIHTPLMRATEMLHETASVTGVDMDFTQTMVDHELATTHAQNALPDLEKTELAGEASLQAYMRGDPLPGDPGEDLTTPVPPQPPLSLPPVAAAPTIAYYAVSDDAVQANPATTQPVRTCSSCGARQAQGRYCIHCGHEFVRTPRAVPILVEQATIIVDPGKPEESPRVATAAGSGVALRRNRIYLGLFIAVLGILAWWSRH